MADSDAFNEGLGPIGGGIRRVKRAFDEADEAFIQALEGLRAITLERGTVEQQLRDMRETIRELQQIVMEQTAQIRELRARLNGGAP